MAIDPLDETVTAALRAWQVQHGAGTDVARTLESCAAICADGPARECFLTASRNAAAGIEEILRALQPLLSAAELALLAAGWKTGCVEQVLAGMATRRELLAKARKRVRSKLLLPLAVLLLASLVAPLPGLIAGGSTAVFLLSVLAPLVAAFALWRVSVFLLQARGATVRRQWLPAALSVDSATADRVLLDLPFLGEMERQRNLAEFAGLLGLLYQAGVPLNAALEDCARAAPSSMYRQGIMRCAGSAGQGQPLASALRDEQLWPAPFVAAVAVGEKSGALGETLVRLGGEARSEYGRAVEKLSAWLPGVAYCLVAAFVILQIGLLVWRVAEIYREVLQ